MKELLELENIKVEEDQIIDFKELYWDPMLELKF
jgi:hypothetical protein